MNLSNKQKMLLHVAAAQAGVNEDERRLIQRNVGGFHSAADTTTTREGFIAVMAFYEARAGGALDGFTAGYWRQADAEASPADATRYHLRRIAEEIDWPAGLLDRFIAGPHMSNGACTGIDDAPEYWLLRAIEALKVIKARARRGGNLEAHGLQSVGMGRTTP